MRAAAPGRVGAVRDGEADRPLAGPSDRAAISGRECGNGVLIDHGDGWQTQYCHLARGSIGVSEGQTVRTGDRLGLVGLSGNTQFPHLHIGVRQGARIVDPFAPDLTPGRCAPQPSTATLWNAATARALAYRETEIINSGFSVGAVTMDAIDEETVRTPSGDPDALVFYGRAIGLQTGDRISVRIVAPDGSVVAENGADMPSPKAQWMLFAGRRRPPVGWLPGTYRARFAVEGRDGKMVAREETISLPAPTAVQP